VVAGEAGRKNINKLEMMALAAPPVLRGYQEH
jgi:hypothetical protein